MTGDDLGNLGRFAARFDDELRSRFARAREEIHEPREGAGGEVLLDTIEDLTLRGGKRLRPYLAHLAALSVEPEERLGGLLTACCALELLQTYLLIHDDIMDGDDMRRGGPTAHRLLASAVGDDEGGRMLAILAGDLAATMSRRALEVAPLDPERRGRAAQELSRMEWEVIQGQTMDLLGSPDVETMHDLKTASYTTRGPVRFGAALAGAGEEALASLIAYATPLGLAFQLRDDLLDMTGDSTRTGKAVGTDLLEGRVSAVIAEALARADDAQQQRIRAAWGVSETHPDQLTDALAAIEQTGALEACSRRARDLTTRATDALDRALLREEGRQGLQQIARALAARVH